MSKAVPMASLSATDAAFLYLERKEIPMNIASVCVFESAIPFEEFVATVRSKLRLIPRYRQIVVAPQWGLGLPCWKDDPHFDIRQHVLHVTLEPPGGKVELEALAGRIFSGLLDRNKPLWDVHVVDGLKDGRGALIWRVHHALADGISGEELLKVMLDASPEGAGLGRKPHFRRTPAASRQGDEDVIQSIVRTSLENLVKFEEGLLAFAQALLNEKTRNDFVKSLELLPELAASVERLPFNRPCGGERKFCWAEFHLAEVQAIRDAGGGTVNDVVLAVLTRALARYVKVHGQSVTNRLVRIVCPVSLRQGNHCEDLGNQISFLPIALPMDVRNPVRLLQAVAKRTATMKRSVAAHLVGLIGSWIASAPAPLQALFWSAIPDIILPVPLLNMICTNIPGPPQPLYALGRRMIAAYPQVPTGYDLGVGCAVQSYDGRLFFGFVADGQAAPDVTRLRDFVVASFRELQNSAEAEGAKRRRGAETKAETQEQEGTEAVPTAASESAKPDETMNVSPTPEAKQATQHAA